MSYENITYEINNTTAVLTINRPEEMNTWNAAVAAELCQALHRANEDDKVRCRDYLCGQDFLYRC